jgi:hypothetical protein
VTQVDFKVSGSADAFWIAVDQEDVRLRNGNGSAELASGPHILTWHFVGKAGATLSIVGNAGVREVVNVKESKVPPKARNGAGYRRFKV